MIQDAYEKHELFDVDPVEVISCLIAGDLGSVEHFDIVSSAATSSSTAQILKAAKYGRAQRSVRMPEQCCMPSLFE